MGGAMGMGKQLGKVGGFKSQSSSRMLNDLSSKNCSDDFSDIPNLGVPDIIWPWKMDEIDFMYDLV